MRSRPEKSAREHKLTRTDTYHSRINPSHSKYERFCVLSLVTCISLLSSIHALSNYLSLPLPLSILFVSAHLFLFRSAFSRILSDLLPLSLPLYLSLPFSKPLYPSVCFRTSSSVELSNANQRITELQGELNAVNAKLISERAVHEKEKEDTNAFVMSQVDICETCMCMRGKKRGETRGKEEEDAC